MHAIRAVRISNILYRSDIISAFEAAKGYVLPISFGSPLVHVDGALVEAHDNLVARRTLTNILRSNNFTLQKISPGDLVQVYMKRGLEKRGTWLSPNQII